MLALHQSDKADLIRNKFGFLNTDQYVQLLEANAADSEFEEAYSLDGLALGEAAAAVGQAITHLCHDRAETMDNVVSVPLGGSHGSAGPSTEPAVMTEEELMVRERDLHLLTRSDKR